MKQAFRFMAGAGLLALMAVLGNRNWDRPLESAPLRPPAVVGGTTEGTTLTVHHDPVLIYQKAFWRRPGREDIILHAERREWASQDDGIRRWQWFIVCEPGPGMTAWLATNPFSLPPARPPREADFPDNISSAPGWFSPELNKLQIQKSEAGALIWMMDKEANRLYAMDEGKGFLTANPAP